MKKCKKSLIMVIMSLSLIMAGCILIHNTADAHRTWKKITKLPNGKYTIDRGYYNEKSWLIDGIKLKIKGNKLTLNCAVKKSNGRVYCSDPLKLKISKKCKYYVEGPLGSKRKSKKKFLKEQKNINKYMNTYDNFGYFKVKNNKVTLIHIYSD